MSCVRIAFANQKGGVGKSTICTQIAFQLAIKEKKKVLIVDMDAQGNTTTVLMQGKPLTGTRTVELFNEDLKEISVTETDFGIDLIGSPKNDREGYNVESLPIEAALVPRKNLEKIWDDYDFVLIDCPPSLGRKLLSALNATKYVLCPIKLSGFAVDGLEGLFMTIYDVKQQINHELEVLGILINEYDQSAAHNKALERVREAMEDMVFKSFLRHRPPLDTATMEGQPIWRVRNGQRAAEEMKAVVNEMQTRINTIENRK